MTTTPTKSAIVDRREFLAELDGSLHHGNAPLALALVDLDEFGPLNIAHSYERGDEVLAAVEHVVATNVPNDALVRRLGGDEYAVVLPGMSAENALVLLDEIRRHVVEHPPEWLGGEITLSVGVAANPPHASDAEDLWRASGEALMRAKREGSNRVAIYVEEKMTLKSNYYGRASLERLAKLAALTSRTEASILRESLDDVLAKYDR